MPLIPASVHQKLFGETQKPFKATNKQIEAANDHLKKCKIDLGDHQKQTSVQFPDLEQFDFFGNIETHFKHIAKIQIEPYEKALELISGKIPNLPSKWSFSEGWTRYDPKSQTAERVDVPEGDVLVFDIETSVKEGPWPIMATAVSPDAWYSWTSPYLIDISKKPANPKVLTPEDLIPIGDHLLIIGHNVSFDRARIANQYNLVQGKTRFLDTMALHITTCGMTSHQRMFKQMIKSKMIREGENGLEQGS